MTRAFSDSLAWHALGLEQVGDVWETSRPPDPDTRKAMTLRRNELADALGERSRDRERNEEWIAGMMLAYRSTGRCSESEAGKITALYAKVVADRPSWAVRRACEQIARGEAADVSLDFPPSAPRMREVVNRLLEPLYVEVHQLRCVLIARARRVIPPEEREAINRRFGELLDDLKRHQRACNLGEEADRAYAEHLAQLDEEAAHA